MRSKTLLVFILLLLIRALNRSISSVSYPFNSLIFFTYSLPSFSLSCTYFSLVFKSFLPDRNRSNSDSVPSCRSSNSFMRNSRIDALSLKSLIS